MLRPFTHLVACCWELLRKVWSWSNFEPTAPNISFVPWSPKRSATMLDQFAQLFQSGPCTRIPRDLLQVTNFYRMYPPQDALQVPKFLGVVASVYTCSFMWLNDAFFLCPQNALLSMLYSKRNWWNPYYLRRIWCLVKRDLNLQENCSSYLLAYHLQSWEGTVYKLWELNQFGNRRRDCIQGKLGWGGGGEGDEKETKTWLHFYRFKWHRDKYAKYIPPFLHLVLA